MGHTVSSQREAVERLVDELQDYADALREDEQELFEELLQEPLRHVGAMSSANSMHVWAFTLLSVIVEQEKRLREVESADRRVREDGLGRVVEEEWR